MDFSIIMPVYNAEKYLRRAVESVLKQRFDGTFELILVNDASTDGSRALCQTLAEEDGRVVVLNNVTNLGPAGTRNRGIEKATGDYLLFMDSDDWVDDGLYQQLKDLLKEFPCDLVLFGLVEEYMGKGKRENFSKVVRLPEKRFLSRNEARAAFMSLEFSTLLGYPYNKVYRTQRVQKEGIRFSNLALYEDAHFNYAYFDSIETLCTLSVAPYHYNRGNADSVTGRWVASYFALSVQREQAVADRLKRWNLYTEENRGKIGTILSRYVFSAIERTFDEAHPLSTQERKAIVQAYMNAPLVQETVPSAKPFSHSVRIFARLIQKRRVGQAIRLGRFIHTVKRHHGALFSHLRGRH